MKKNKIILLWVFWFMWIPFIAYGNTVDPIKTFFGNLIFLIIFSIITVIICFITFYKPRIKE